MHVFMYVCYRAAGAVGIAESCGQGQRWHGSEVTQFSPLTEVEMDGGGQERSERHETERLGDTAACPKKRRVSSLRWLRAQTQGRSRETV